MAGLDPGFDPAIRLLAKRMDPRAKPAGEAERCAIAGFLREKKKERAPAAAIPGIMP
jgi:hypothetical protein